MRVIQLAPTPFGPGGILGGGERYPLELARALVAHLDCELVTFGPMEDIYRQRSGLFVRTIRRRALIGGHPAHPLSLQLPRALAGADIVHTHHMRSAPSQMAAMLALWGGQKAVTTDHGLQGEQWGRLLPRLYDHFLPVSCFSARELGLPPARTAVIYGGADPERFHPDPLDHRSGILFVGRLTPHKGVDRLIAALPSGANLSLVGSAGHDPGPPERDYSELLRRLAVGRKVRFMGPVPDGDLAALYRQASVFVLPSVDRTCYGREVRVSELLGLSVLEAMASGTPVVVSRLGGLPEIVEHGVTGFLVEPGNVPELRDRLDQLLRNRQLARRMGANAHEAVLARFTWERVAERCLQVYEKL